MTGKHHKPSRKRLMQLCCSSHLVSNLKQQHLPASQSEIRLEINVAQMIFTKTRCFFPVRTYTVQPNLKLEPISCLRLPFQQENLRDIFAAIGFRATGKPVLTYQFSDIKLICCGDVKRSHLQRQQQRGLDLP